MRISVFGLGYVGCTTAACLAKDGHDVIGVDINVEKVKIINNGRSPIVEKDLDKIVSRMVKKKKLRATVNSKEAVRNSEVSLICVGTPSNNNGSLNLNHIRRVCKDIGLALSGNNTFHVVVIRSTLLPGITEGKLIPNLERHSGRKVNLHFGVCVNPEFLREGSSVDDFYNPPIIVIGEANEKSGKIVENMYRNFTASVIRTTIKTAEMIKYVSNAFHALKICFANEIGNICKREGIDSGEVMRIFCMDTQLNLSPRYLQPGFAFGGSCLPKDLRALVHKGRQMDLDLPVLESILQSNEIQIKNGIDLIWKTKKKKIGILGLSFKPGTDDLRESPIVRVVEILIGKGLNVKIYDKNVSVAKLFGANKQYIMEKIPCISSLLLSSVERVIEESEVIVVGYKDEDFGRALQTVGKNKIIIDFARQIDNPRRSKK